MQTGGGCGDRAGAFGEQRLIAALVPGIGRALEIGRQRQLAVALHQRPDVALALPAQVEEITLAPEQLEGALPDLDQPARPGLLAHAQLRQHLAAVVEHAFDEDFRPPAAGLAAVQARLDHPGVVEHDQIAGGQQRGKIQHLPVVQAVGGDMQQPRRGARLDGVPGDPLGGQFVMEVLSAHPGIVPEAEPAAAMPAAILRGRA